MVSKPIEDSFHILEREQVDLKVMRGLCANGIPFNVLRNPQFVEMVTAINRGPKGYKAPSFEKARTVLLDECKRNVEKDLSPIQDTWYSQGVSIVSDGWTNVKHKPLINVLAVNSRGAMFMYAEDFSGVEKIGSAIAKFLLKAIEEIGPSNVLQVVTDNATNCKAAGHEIEKNGKAIVKYMNNHTQSLAMFRANSTLELLKVAKTRFASHYVLLKRLLDCKDALITIVVRDAWKEWVKQGDECTRTKGSMVAEIIRSEEFWEEVKNIIQIIKPIYLLIKFCDGEGPKMGEFYEKMDTMLGEIKDIMGSNKYADCYPKMESIIIKGGPK
ncbi:uncharacterized protein LOC127786803 [Diospyros lotus]|uniref:uncharacterized protein LOC127786803 n=1 Tax=Diospyros lotus TaxID=55363 RepID=UPI00224E1405|nr:uncharacterized protein LOC127786803 [Diospyros lotus]